MMTTTGTRHRSFAEPDRQALSADQSISVLVPLLNEADSLEDTIQCLAGQDYKGDIEFILVDGGSSDGTLDMLRALERRDARFRVYENPARVTPAALNIALDAAEGEIVARMDGHNVYPGNYLRSGAERLGRGDVASVSGPMLPSGDSLWSRRVSLALQTWLGTGDAAYRHPIDSEIEVDSGFTGMWLRTTLLQHGGWDEQTYPNEDAELAARIRATGQRIVCIPDMAAGYSPRDSLRGLARQYWSYGVYRARTAVRQPNSLRRSHVLAPALALTALVAPLPIPKVAVVARCGLLAYLVTIVATSASMLKREGRDALALPLVFATMHLTWGFGFVRGVTLFGIPVTAMKALAKKSALAVEPEGSL